MSFTKEVTIWCDGPNCFMWDTLPEGSVGEARRILRKSGWRKDGDGDYCPECVKKVFRSSKKNK